MLFSCMNVMSLYGELRHVWVTYVAIFMVVSARIQIYLQYVRITPQLTFNYKYIHICIYIYIYMYICMYMYVISVHFKWL